VGALMESRALIKPLINILVARRHVDLVRVSSALCH
jgi:hypothetical protein